MPVTYSVFTRILGEDFASEAFRKVGNAARAAFKPIEEFNKALKKPETTALGQVGAKVDMVAGKFRGALKYMAEWAPALAAIGTAASFGGLIEMTKKAAEGYKGLTLGAQRLGASTGDLAVWRYGAKLAGVEAEALEKGLIKANKAMYDAATGKNKDVAALFAAMKIPLRDAKGGVKGVSNSLEDIAEAFKNTHNPATRDAAAMVLFGKAGAQLIPFLVRGREGIAELREEMKKYSGLSDKNRSDLEHLAESYEHIEKAGTGLSSKLSAVFAPILSRVIDKTTDWVVANREILAQSLDRKLNHIATAFSFVAKCAQAAAEFVGLDKLFKGADAATAFDAALALLGVTMAGPLFASLQLVTAAWWRMTAAMLANPFVAVGVAIAAVAYAIYANWDKIVAWFDEKVEAVRKAFNLGFGSGLRELFLQFNPFTLVENAVEGLLNWLGIKVPSFESVWKKILPASALKMTAAYQASYAAGPQAPAPTAPSDVADAYQRSYATKYGLPPAPSPDSPAAVAQAAAPKAKVEVSVDFTNVPKGVEVKTTSTNVAPSVNIGRSMHDQFGV